MIHPTWSNATDSTQPNQTAPPTHTGDSPRPLLSSEKLMTLINHQIISLEPRLTMYDNTVIVDDGTPESKATSIALDEMMDQLRSHIELLVEAAKTNLDTEDSRRKVWNEIKMGLKATNKAIRLYKLRVKENVGSMRESEVEELAEGH